MLYVVGTSHHYQFGAGARFGDRRCTEEDEAAFASLLREIATSLGIAGLAEELNRQALEEVGKQVSVAERIASALRIQHFFCEPDRSERVALGIKDENQIRMSAFPNFLPEDEVQELIAEHWQKREQEWLRRMEGLKEAKVLLVCGADHVSTFIPLASQQGHQCEVIHANWEA